MKKILFQGDSITDCSRMRDRACLGGGYANFVGARMGFDYPGQYEFVNKGISGDRIVDLYARIKRDFINIAPDYLSIMVGVNDVWHEISCNNGVSEQKFEKIYTMLIEEIQEALPNTKIMLIEPYLTKGSGTEGELADGSDKYTYFRSEVQKRASIVKKLAHNYGFVFVELQNKLDELCKIMPAHYLTEDGVHPTRIGHEFIARQWIEGFKKI